MRHFLGRMQTRTMCTCANCAHYLYAYILLIEREKALLCTALGVRAMRFIHRGKFEKSFLGLNNLELGKIDYKIRIGIYIFIL